MPPLYATKGMGNDKVNTKLYAPTILKQKFIKEVKSAH